MSISSRIEAIEEHLTQDYVMLEKLGFYNNENKNIQNISPILENFYNKVGNKTKIVKDGIVGETSQETTNGYQLINQPTTETSSTHNGLTYKSLPDGTLSVKGTATANQQYFLNCSTGAFQETSAYISLPAGTYTAKYIVISGTMTFNIRLRTGTTNIINAMQEGANTFTLSEDISNFNVYFYTSNNVARDIEFKLMLEKGSTSHDWEKYTGGIPAPNPDYPMPVNTRTGELSYKVQGKNLINKSRQSQTLNGVTLTNNGNGTYTLNGTATANTSFDFYSTDLVLPYGTYTLSGCPAGGSTSTYKLAWNVGGTTTNDLGDGVSYTGFATDRGVWLTIYSGYTCNNLVFKPMIEKGSTKTSFEPYISRTFPINLGNIELCKIGTYQDYISKENGVWYKHNAIYKDTYNGSESYWYGASQSISSYYRQVSYAKVTGASNFYSDKFSYLGNAQSTELGYALSFNTNSSSNRYMYVQVPSTVVAVNNVEAFKTWLSSNNFSVYYPLATPTTTVITDEELISQLDAIEDFLTQYKINDEFILGYDEPSVEY